MVTIIGNNAYNESESKKKEFVKMRIALSWKLVIIKNFEQLNLLMFILCTQKWLPHQKI